MFEWLRGRGRGRAATPTYDDPFEGLTEGALRVVALAREESRHLGHSYIGTEHVLLGLLREDEGTAATVLKGSGMDLDGARGSVEGIVGQDDGTPGPGEVPFTPRAKGVLRLARLEALRLDHDHVGAEYLLLGLVRDAEEGEGLGVAARVLVDLGVDRQEVRQRASKAASSLEARRRLDGGRGGGRNRAHRGGAAANKAPTVLHRLQRRIVATGSQGIEGYSGFPSEYPEEYQQLVNSFPMKVTEPFRDAGLFEYLRETLPPELIEEAREHDNGLRTRRAGKTNHKGGCRGA